MNQQAEFLISMIPKWQRSALEYLIQTENELNEFMAYYENEKINLGIRSSRLEQSSRIRKAMIKYRIDRMTKMSMSFDEFEELYDKDSIKAFTRLYQQSVPDRVFKRIFERINSGQVSLKHYYEYPPLDPEEFLMRLANRIIDQESLDFLRRIKSKEIEVFNQKEEDNINIPEPNEYNSLASTNKSVRDVSVQRLVRDTKMAKQIKLLYKGKCQLCENKIKSTHGFITEAHHIRPYNKTHQGDDTYLNLIVLCPNCHSRFDDFYYAIHPESHLVHSLDELDEHHLKKVYLEKGHNFGEEYLNYAWNIFLSKG